MNRHLPEVGMALVLLLGAIWMVPSQVFVEESSQPIAFNQQPGVVDSIVNEMENPEDWRHTPTRMSQALKSRNIFDRDGKYDQPKTNLHTQGKAGKAGKAGKVENGVSPAVAKTFTLVAVLQGDAPSAIFRDSSGSLSLYHEGDQLTKKARITRIGKLKVTVRNGKKEKVYEIFHIPQSGEQQKSKKSEVRQ